MWHLIFETKNAKGILCIIILLLVTLHSSSLTAKRVAMGFSVVFRGQSRSKS